MHVTTTDGQDFLAAPQVDVRGVVEAARDVADRICFLDAGRILEEGPPSVMLATPREERTQRFLQRIISAGRL